MCNKQGKSIRELNWLYDIGFNPEVGEESALYWSGEDGNLAALIEQVEKFNEATIIQHGINASDRILDEFSWESIEKI